MRVLDIGCGSHLVSSLQGISISMKVDKEDVNLQVANEARVAALAVGSYYVYLQGYFQIIDIMYFCLGMNIIDIMFWISKKEIYNVNTKRPKSDNLMPLYLWHCHLSHINRHAYLSKGCLGSFDLESYETCESCLSGK